MQAVQLGSISTGTLRTEDLLDAVIGEADYLFGADYLDTHKDSNDWIIKPLIDAKAVTDYDSEDAGYILDDLIDALNGLYVELNDHGNTTVKQLGGDVIWSTV